MGHHDHDQQHRDHELVQRLEAIGPAIERVEAALARFAVPGSWLRLPFTAAERKVLDDKGANAVALALYNPNNFTIFIGAGGASAAPDSFPVPPNKLVVAPLQVNGPIEFLAEGVEPGFAWRVRFPTPQPFTVADL